MPMKFGEKVFLVSLFFFSFSLQSDEKQDLNKEVASLNKEMKEDIQDVNLQWSDIVTRPASYIWAKGNDALDYFKDLVKIGFDATRSLNASLSLYRDTYLDRSNYYQLMEKYNQPPEFRGSKAGESRRAYRDHVTTDATVTVDDRVWKREEDYFVPNRLNHVEKTIQQLFPNKKLKKSKPRIAICASGGGFRAMMAAAGLYKALETRAEEIDNETKLPAHEKERIKQKLNGIRLIDTVTWASALSGGTWVTIPRAFGKSIDSLIKGYETYAKVSVSTAGIDEVKNAIGFDKGTHLEVAKDNIIRKFINDLPVDAMDLYGALVIQMAGGPFDDLSLANGADKYQNYVQQDRQRVLFSQALEYLEADNCKNFPLPIGTAVSPLHGWWNPGRQRATKSKMQWFGFSPYALESFYYKKDGSIGGSHIPIWAVDRKFEAEYENKGATWFSFLYSPKVKQVKSKKDLNAATYSSELPLGNLMATWGSAFAISPRDIIRLFISENALQKPSTMLDHVLSLLVTAFAPLSSLTNNLRLFPSTIHNFTKDLEDTSHGERYLTFIDAGIDFNLPFPPLLWKNSKGQSVRDVDIIIVLDSSAPVIATKKQYKNWYSSEFEEESEIAELIKAENWARIQGIPFPKIKGSKEHADAIIKDEDGYVKHAITVFPSQDGSPTLIFIPLHDNEVSKQNEFNVAACMAADCTTFNFKYSKENVQGLVNHVKETVLNNMDIIVDEIAKVAVGG